MRAKLPINIILVLTLAYSLYAVISYAHLFLENPVLAGSTDHYLMGNIMLLAVFSALLLLSASLILVLNLRGRRRVRK